MVRFRFWLSYVLLNWGIKSNPDPHCRDCLRIGVHIAANLMEDKDESV